MVSLRSKTLYWLPLILLPYLMMTGLSSFLHSGDDDCELGIVVLVLKASHQVQSSCCVESGESGDEQDVPCPGCAWQDGAWGNVVAHVDYMLTTEKYSISRLNQHTCVYQAILQFDSRAPPSA